ncbi:MAG TPA: HD domain-containing phosphohydrolase, partial [Thermoleophilaceae bacterium]|nr:HD domain-containing phosphohydrolase [Thermoleophilaceae bacterium]
MLPDPASADMPSPAVALSSGRSDLRDIARVTRPDGRELAERVLTIARETLGMQLSYLSEWEADELVYRQVERSEPGFLADVEVGGREPLAGTYCKRAVDGELPPLVGDARNDPRTSDFFSDYDPAIGAICSVPLHLSDGRLWGTFCVAGGQADPALAERDLAFMQILAQLVADDIERRELEARAVRSQIEASSVLALVAALDARDNYSAEHSEALVELTLLVAGGLGLSDAEACDVKWMALLHDIGKVGVPDAVLHKPSALDEDEWVLMRRHPEIGARIVSEVDGLRHMAPAILADHERWDGTGYPLGLAGTAIPLPSRITLACDAYHAMVSDRPYRAAVGHA